VGNKSKFNAEGVVPVNSTRKNLLNSEIENDWQYLPLIKALTAIAALLHDWGKASKLFQEKLQPDSKNKFKGDPIRHEWISVILLNALVNQNEQSTDKDWLNCLIKVDFNEDNLKQQAKAQASKPLKNLPPAAKLVAWLIVSHHRLPFIKEDWRDESAANIDVMLNRFTQQWGYENKRDPQEYQQRVGDCFEFNNGLLSQSKEWLKRIKRWANSLQHCLPLIDSAMKDGSYRLVLHHARLCLMLGDHCYSSKDAAINWQDTTGLFANTDRQTNQLKQKLDEHLVGVAKYALDTAHLLPAFEQEPPMARDIQVLRRPSPEAFKWQDKAVANIIWWKKQQDKKAFGFFAVNMASTGCGKTFANAKVMRALSTDGKSLRYILALGLRTLTLQTGDEYRERIKLNKSQLAVLIGSRAVAELHNQTNAEKEQITEEVLGSESKQALLDEFVDYDCEIPEEGLATVLTCDKDKHFLYAPVLACTIDHIIAATETKRGGRYILPSLRLMSSDLVIDEIDDFTGNDLIAIGRLIHLAGMLGRKVMISSATIPPDLALGYFNAYKKGWQLYCQSRHESKAEIGCSWIDEFTSHTQTIKVANSEQDISHYRQLHGDFIEKRVKKLAQQAPKRKADIVACPVSKEDENSAQLTDELSKQEYYFSVIKQAILAKHQHHHSVDVNTKLNVSFGVVRVANISPCIALTKYLLQADFPEHTQVKVMAYHSQQVLLLRHEQEKHLDKVLKRKEKAGEVQQAFNNNVIRDHLEKCCKNNHQVENIIFILVATPVEEVGRDHDFDWAVVEPSSYRSIVQLAGRVRRHRTSATEKANIGLLQYNLKAYKAGDKSGKAYFVRPGYEDALPEPLPFHDLSRLVNEDEIAENLNAIPRIQKLPPKHKQFLAAVEHKVTAQTLANFNSASVDSLQGYLTQTWFLTALPQTLTPFRQSEASTNLFLFYNEIDDGCYFTEKEQTGKPLVDENYQAINRDGILNIKHSVLTPQERENLWLERNYQQLLPHYISEPYLARLKNVSLRYGELNIVLGDNTEYEYNDQFGLVKIDNKGAEKC